MNKTPIVPSGAAPAIGPYSHAVRSGDLLFCSGQIPIDPANPSGPVPTDIREQTRIVLENIQRILVSQSLDFRHVVKSTVFLTNLGDFQAMNELYAQYFPAPYPARSTIQIAALPRGANVEIEVIASYSAV
jgi:2-iminobutanoate/2-iminopropanoate deaminase